MWFPSSKNLENSGAQKTGAVGRGKTKLESCLQSPVNLRSKYAELTEVEIKLPTSRWVTKRHNCWSTGSLLIFQNLCYLITKKGVIFLPCTDCRISDGACNTFVYHFPPMHRLKTTSASLVFFSPLKFV